MSAILPLRYTHPLGGVSSALWTIHLQPATIYPLLRSYATRTANTPNPAPRSVQSGLYRILLKEIRHLRKVQAQVYESEPQTQTQGSNTKSASIEASGMSQFVRLRRPLELQKVGVFTPFYATGGYGAKTTGAIRDTFPPSVSREMVARWQKYAEMRKGVMALDPGVPYSLVLETMRDLFRKTVADVATLNDRVMDALECIQRIGDQIHIADRTSYHVTKLPKSLIGNVPTGSFGAPSAPSETKPKPTLKTPAPSRPRSEPNTESTELLDSVQRALEDMGGLVGSIVDGVDKSSDTLDYVKQLKERAMEMRSLVPGDSAETNKIHSSFLKLLDHLEKEVKNSSLRKKDSDEDSVPGFNIQSNVIDNVDGHGTDMVIITGTIENDPELDIEHSDTSIPESMRPLSPIPSPLLSSAASESADTELSPSTSGDLYASPLADSEPSDIPLVSIEATSEFVPHPSQRVFMYRIAVENVSPSTQFTIEKRTWIISAGGKVVTNLPRAYGLLGKTPTLKPQDSFEYYSNAIISPTESEGDMEGHFHLVVKDKDNIPREVDAKVAKFRLLPNPSSSSSQK